FNTNIRPLNLEENYENVEKALNYGNTLNCNIMTFSKNTFTGNSLHHYINNLSFLNEICNYYNKILNFSKNINSIIIIDSIKKQENSIKSGLFVIYKGEEILFVKNNSYETININGFKTAIINCEFKDTLSYLEKTNHENVNLSIIIQNQNYTVNTFDKTQNLFKSLSEFYHNSISYNSGCLGDSSDVSLKKAFSLNLENGKLISSIIALSQNINDDFLSCITDYDFNFLNAPLHYDENIKSFLLENSQNETLRDIKKDPFYEYYKYYTNEFLASIFDMQVESLSKRMKNANIKNIILPVSGGLDSTMAFLVCVKTLDVLNLDRKNLLAITLPGLGTSDQTYNNAINLIQSQNVSFKEISIKNAVLNHFKDIGHNEQDKSTVYENAQARERTQIALDLANKNNAIFVGTGDLSEDALGFCTFGGDHLANFNINVCLTKTMIRQMVRFIMKSEYFLKSNNTLQDILDTPISPELLPSGDKTISQKTETILGDYILHDFFLFYLLKYNMPLEKIHYYAKKAFSLDYDQKYIKEKFIIFLERFFKNQFKRSCQPDCVEITDINLINGKFMFSSDVDITTFLNKLKNNIE
ncbi:MAG: NAD(+) synthase, partial [Oscillospiraceae bacterium]